MFPSPRTRNGPGLHSPPPDRCFCSRPPIQLTQNVAAVLPFLWILPLAIYLLTFILCFESTRWYRRDLFVRLLAMSLGAVAYAIYDIQFSDAILVGIPIFSLGLFFASACTAAFAAN